jgi:hypothetical protein
MADEQSTGGIIERLRNSPRTVSTIIVILIIAGAIFAFSDRGARPSPSPEAATPEGEETEAPGAAPEVTPGGETPREKGTPEVTKAPPQPAALPEPSETADAYAEVAAKGEGVTHLARTSADRYLEANAPDFQVTNEHRVFIEDYLKDRTGRAPLEIGETRTFSKDLIREAVEASKELTDAQLRNLQKYSRLVQWE